MYKDDLELRVREQSHSVSRFFCAIDKTPPSSFFNSLLLWSRNFATMVTWRHTSPLYKNWYLLITVEPRLRSLKRGLVISRFLSIHYNFIISSFAILRFHCTKEKENRPHPSPQVLTFVPIRSFPSLWILHNPHPPPPPPSPASRQFSLAEV